MPGPVFVFWLLGRGALEVHDGGAGAFGVLVCRARRPEERGLRCHGATVAPVTIWSAEHFGSDGNRVRWDATFLGFGLSCLVRASDRRTKVVLQFF
jgi:hypothetical protein